MSNNKMMSQLCFVEPFTRGIRFLLGRAGLDRPYQLPQVLRSTYKRMSDGDMSVEQIPQIVRQTITQELPDTAERRPPCRERHSQRTVDAMRQRIATLPSHHQLALRAYYIDGATIEVACRQSGLTSRQFHSIRTSLRENFQKAHLYRSDLAVSA